jgi:protein-L-isoaspartate(D-aspartate) O-methyltransferase
MIDFAAARRMMVDGQIRTSDVTDLRLIAAMLDVPRERYVPHDKIALAYLDFDVPVTSGAHEAETRRLLKPVVLARMIQAADVEEGDNVLDVGCATGYSAAILGRLAGSVTALEQDATLARHARENLETAHQSNARVVTGPLVEGWAANGPYDVILLDGATEVAPEALFRQLKEGGRMVAVVGRTPNGRAMLYRCTSGDVTGWPVFDAAAPTLPGFAAVPSFVF